MERERALEAKYKRAISEIAHDIKNPLTAMLGYTSLIKNEAFGPLGDQKYKDFASTVDTAAKRLLDLCNALLDEYVERSEENTTTAEQIVDAAEMLKEIHKLFEVQAKERGISLSSNIGKDFPNLRANPQELHRAITNLVSNAVKFTPKGGKIEIGADVSSKDGTLIMVVRDSGVGMSQEQIRAVTRSHLTTLSPHGDKGTGQGIAVVNRVLRQLGGRLEIVSTENRGTRMKVHLPSSICVERAPTLSSP